MVSTQFVTVALTVNGKLPFLVRTSESNWRGTLTDSLCSETCVYLTKVCCSCKVIIMTLSFAGLP